MKGTGKLDLILMGGFTLLTLATAGFFYYTTYVYQKPLMSETSLKKDALKTEEETVLPTGIQFERLVINLPSNRKRLRFLELEINFLPVNQDAIEKIESLKAQLKDVIITTAGRMSPDELNSISGKILLEERIKKNFREKSNLNLISRIFYTKFIVQ